MSPTTTSKYTLVGYPLTDSISLYVHEKLFELSNKNSIYDLYAISQQNFKESIEDLMAHDGFNVTVPYKNAIRVIDTMQAQAHHDLLINASPIGLSPHISECPVPDKAIERVDAIFDFICNPVQTRLLKLAEENGKPCSNGIPMLVWQAVGAHRIWYDAQFADEDIEELIENTEAMVASGFTQDSSERACQI